MRSKFQFLAAAIVLCTILGIVVYSEIHKRSINSEHANVERVADIEAKPGALHPHGLMTKPDYMRLHDIGVRVRANQPMATSDFDFMIAMLRQTPPHDQESYTLADPWVLAIFSDDKRLSPNQKQQLYEATIPLLSKEDEVGHAGSVKIWACRTMSRIANKNVVPYVLPLLNDSRPAVQKSATNVLRSVGYKMR